PKEEIVGHTLEELLPPEVARTFRDAIEAVVASGAEVAKTEEVPVNNHSASFKTTLFPAQEVDGKVTLVGVMSVATG
ncbi:MAG: PAS domain-containing protein, partial [Alkalispirochaetaceae bacterium]